MWWFLLHCSKCGSGVLEVCVLCKFDHFAAKQLLKFLLGYLLFNMLNIMVLHYKNRCLTIMVVLNNVLNIFLLSGMFD